MSYLLLIVYIISCIVILGFQAFANQPPLSFTYQGKIYKANGIDPLEAPAVTFKIQIRSNDATCLLFEETHLRDMTNTQGIFALVVGAGTNTHATALNLFQVFENTTSKVGAGGCNYTPVSGDTRKIRLIYNDTVEEVTFATDQTIRSVPYAINAMSVGGMGKNDFIQVTSDTTQNKLDTVLGHYTTLMSLANGTNTTYAKASDLPVTGGWLDLTSGGLKVADTPALGSSAVNKNYCDAHIGGKVIDQTSLGDGEVLVWNATASKWEGRSMTLSSADVIASLGFTPFNKSGDTLGGDLQMASHNITNVGYLTIAANKYLGLGKFGASDEATLVTTVLTPGGTPYAGATWYNSSDKVIKYWAGTSLETVATKDYSDFNLGGNKISLGALNNTTDLGKSLVWSGVALGWVAQTPANGSVTSLTAGTGLSGGTITTSGTISLANIGTSGTYTKVTTDAQGRITSGGALLSTDIPAPAGDVTGTQAATIVQKIQGVAVSSAAPTNNQILKYNSANSRWEPSTDVTNLGTVTSIVAGTGLTGGTITGSGTLAVDVGTTANKIVQLDASGKLPAIDASALTNLAPFTHVVPFSSAGTTSWTVPAGVTRIYVQAWGAGGGGGGGTNLSRGGGGGGAGAYGAEFLTVVPGVIIPLKVGAHGAGGTVGASGIVGGGGSSRADVNGAAGAAPGGGGGGGGSGAVAGGIGGRGRILVWY